MGVPAATRPRSGSSTARTRDLGGNQLEGSAAVPGSLDETLLLEVRQVLVDGGEGARSRSARRSPRWWERSPSGGCAGRGSPGPPSGAVSGACLHCRRRPGKGRRRSGESQSRVLSALEARRPGLWIRRALRAGGRRLWDWLGGRRGAGAARLAGAVPVGDRGGGDRPTPEAPADRDAAVARGTGVGLGPPRFSLGRPGTRLGLSHAGFGLGPRLLGLGFHGPLAQDRLPLLGRDPGALVGDVAAGAVALFAGLIQASPSSTLPRASGPRRYPGRGPQTRSKASRACVWRSLVLGPEGQGQPARARRRSRDVTPSRYIPRAPCVLRRCARSGSSATATRPTPTSRTTLVSERSTMTPLHAPPPRRKTSWGGEDRAGNEGWRRQWHASWPNLSLRVSAGVLGGQW